MNQQTRPSRGIFLAYTSFVGLCSLIMLAAMILSPSEPGRAVIFGLSLARLLFTLGFLSAFVLFAGLFLKAVRDAAWAETTFEAWFGGGRFSRALIWFAGAGLGLGWIGCFLPSYRTGPLEPHWARIQPLMIFLLITSLATLAVFLVGRIERASQHQGVFRLSFFLFLAGLLVFAWMYATKYGIYSSEDFWYGAGVPLLASQLLLAILGGVLFLLVRWNWEAGRKDLLVGLLLYAVTAILWAREPLQKSFLFTPPRPPNNALYPFADAAAFDAGSQFALIGQGIYIFNNSFTDRPLYLSHLVYLHSLFGQNYELMMMAQAAVFAVLPAIIYLIGRSLNIRSVGFAAALVAMFRGMNSIAASSMIDLASPKMILSDFPAAIGVALIILSTCEWLKKADQKPYYAIWVGGAIGLTMMIRPHGLVLLLLIPIFALVHFRHQWKQWLLACLLIGLGTVAITLPWELRNVARGGVMYSSLVTKIQDVIRTRYHGPVNQTGSLLPHEKLLSMVTLQNTTVAASFYGQKSIVQEAGCNSIICFTPNHFLHNTITSILLLPTSPVLDNLWHTVKEAHPYWKADWNGMLDPLSLFFLIMNLFLTVLGISVLWKNRGLPAMVPLAVFTIYNLANSLARTSGGRYIVPMDWIIPLYFMAGILFLITETARVARLGSPSLFEPETIEKESTPPSRVSWQKALLGLVILFAAGSLVPLSERLYQPRYADFNPAASLQEYRPQIEASGLTLEKIQTFLNTPGAETLVGRTLYPRSYKTGQGEISFYFYPFTNMDFPRTGFFLIGPHGQDNIILPGGIPQHLPHADDVLVIGCREQNYVDALLVIVLDDSKAVYPRSPLSELACPMKQPVCDKNSCQ